MTRFLFGAGEAGAFPNAAIAVARWFPVHERGRAFGIALMASQLGGAFAPLLVVPIQIRYGWRASFYAFGILGVAWSVVWYRWFRDSPAEKPGVSQAELAETRDLVAKARHGLPWRIALRSGNLWAMMAVAGGYVYTYYFFQSWFHTYLVKGRGYSEAALMLSSLPFLVGACANLGGGLASEALVKGGTSEWARRAIGAAGMGTAAVCAIAVMFAQQWLAALILLAIVYGAICFQQPTMFAVCLDIGGEYAGSVAGAMNTAAQIGSMLSSVVFGFLVDRYGSYDLPFIPMAVLLVSGAWLWLKIDPTRLLIPKMTPETPPGSPAGAADAAGAAGGPP